MARVGGKADPAFGLKISPSVVLRNLLQQYPSGGQFFLEGLQNADDTGRAGKFCALLDLRKHPAARLRQPAAARAHLQGEAVVFYDNAGFQPRDWRSLQFMCDSVKRQSPHEAGVFGMGSRSFFHITDVLQVLSGTMLSALDPDDMLESGHFGEQIDFVEDELLDRFPDEGAPFLGMFGCDMRTEFPGTIIRASLRSPERAERCTFMPRAFDLSRAKRIFAEFEEVLKNGEVILFLSCIANVELWRWDAEAVKPSLITRTSLGVSSGHALPRQVSGPREVKAYLKRFNSFADVEADLQKPGTCPPHVLDIVEIHTEGQSAGNSRRKWLRYGRFVTDADILRLAGSCSCVPAVALALPLGHEVQGTLFASLPLPLPTRLPVHANASFRLHDNRRAIWRARQDLDGEHCQWAEWNEVLLQSALPQVYAEALGLLAGTAGIASDYGHAVWPREKEVEKEFCMLLDPLVGALGRMPVLPTPLGDMVCPADATFFPTPTAALQRSRGRLLKLCADAGHKVVDPPEHIVALLEARGAITTKACTWVLWDVLLPAITASAGSALAQLLLVFIEWAATWPALEVKDLANRLQSIAWIPTDANVLRAIRESFDPAASPTDLSVVKKYSARVDDLIVTMGLDADAVFGIMRRCGLKQQITWDDAMDEATLIKESADAGSAELLIAHLNKHHGSLSGSRTRALEHLQQLAWVPATKPTAQAEPQRASQLLRFQEVFPPSARKLVWAVAPCMCIDCHIEELRPGRKVDAEPEVLVEQVRSIAEAAAVGPSGERHVSASTLEHLRTAFGAMLPLMSKLPSLDNHARLRDVPFLPCLTCDETGEGAGLFAARQAALQAQHDHTALSPIIGIVKPADNTVRMIAEAAGVAKEPRADVLAEALHGLQQHSDPRLAVALAVELAARLRAGEDRPTGIMVPTSDGRMECVESVCINDASWCKQQTIPTLHKQVSAEDGYVLGCTSLRERLASDCEAGHGEWLPGEDKGDSLSQLRQHLQDCGEDADLLFEFLRRADAEGAGCAAFFLCEEDFSTERLVDLRAGALQGSALYLCCDGKPTTKAGGLAEPTPLMFSCCDCPQLLTSGRLQFFDPLRQFVAGPGMQPRRCFAMDTLREHFQDNTRPFDTLACANRFPVVFRLALRTSASDLGRTTDVQAWQKRMEQAAMLSEHALLFMQSIRRVEFHRGSALIAAYEASEQSKDSYSAFLAKLPSSLSDMSVGEISTCATRKMITAEQPTCTNAAEWLIVHSAGVSDSSTLQAFLAAHSGLPPGVACTLRAAAAVRLQPTEQELRGAKICCGTPTSMCTNACAWVQGDFALPPSRKLLPLTADGKPDPSSTEQWNTLLLRGPVVDSMRSLVVHCTPLFLERRLDRKAYFALFPKPGSQLQNALCAAVFSPSWVVSQIILPVRAASGEEGVAALALAFLEWAGSNSSEAEVSKLGEELSAVPWLPTSGGTVRKICDVFMPSQSPGHFRTVGDKQVRLDDLIADRGFDSEVVWHVFRLLGMKTEMTWEDAVEEAESIVQHGDVERARMLLLHLNEKHPVLRGCRAAAIHRLESLAWVPANEPAVSPEASQGVRLLRLSDAFPPSEMKLVCAVAPTLCVESTMTELQPGRTTQAEPEILVEQVRALALSAVGDGSAPPHVPASTLKSLSIVFSALLPYLSRLPSLADHPRLRNLAFVPCKAANDADEGAELFAPRRAAFRTHQVHRALRPVIGVVKSSDQATRIIAEAAGVTSEACAEALAEALSAASASATVTMALAAELAARLRAGEARPAAVMLPTSCGSMASAEVVHVDDASWGCKRGIMTLHAGISADDGRLLGCPSLRGGLAQRCEAGAVLMPTDCVSREGTSPVSQVRTALQECGDEVAVIPAFVRYSEHVGAGCVAVFLSEDGFSSEKVLDSRLDVLQGAALYLCMDQTLSSKDILRLQELAGTHAKANASLHASDNCCLSMMYRYSDCPQLLTDGHLIFFDLLRKFIVKSDSGWQRSFQIAGLQEHFPDSHAPFEVKSLTQRFGTVFRLALRKQRSDMGAAAEPDTVRRELQRVAEEGDKMLLFSQHLRRLEFHDGASLIATHEVSALDLEGSRAFFAGLPASLSDLSAREPMAKVFQKTISSEGGASGGTAEWAVSHVVGIPSSCAPDELKLVSHTPEPASWLPHGAAAVQVRPCLESLHGGHFCCLWPLPLQSSCGAWVHGTFRLPLSQKSLPLPSAKDATPSPDKAWNRALMEGPVALSIRALAVHCISLFRTCQMSKIQFFSLFPSPGSEAQSLLASSVFSVQWILSDIIEPATSTSSGEGLTGVVLAFLEWASSWKECHVKELSTGLADMRWVPTAGGDLRTIRDSFDPERSPDGLRIVRNRQAKVDHVVARMGLDASTVLRMLRLCGLKDEISWEDAVEEAEAAVHDSSVEAAEALLLHLNKHHDRLHGSRATALQRLQDLEWAPTKGPKSLDPQPVSQLLAWRNAFASSAHNLVWAVAPCMTVESLLQELQPGRTTEAEPEILIEQVRAIAEAAATNGIARPRISGASLGHLRAVFAALLPLLSKVPNFEEHPRLRGVPFIPCLTPDDAGEDAVLFPAARAAFRAQHDHRALSPAIGIAKATDSTLRLFAEAAGVPREPRAEVLAAALCGTGPEAPAHDAAVALAIELASRLRAGEARPACVKVPTSTGSIENVGQVYIDDTPWQHHRQIATLHSRIGAEDGRLLGCTSLRGEMARQCEDDAASAGDGDSFGQETDLVSQVRQLLLEYGDGLDLVTEFVQNSDDAGASRVAFFLQEDAFGAERVVDPRTAELRGAALYVCSDKPLSSEDIARMQSVGQSKKRLDFGSSGRFGVGLNVMYRHCDCPQLLANGRLHFFDLTRSYVSRHGMSRGRQFTVQKLHENFPDSHAPFELGHLDGVFPTIFRLALRKRRSELGNAAEVSTVREELRRASAAGDKMLLFARHLRCLEFHDGATVLASHDLKFADSEGYAAFFSRLPTSLPQLRLGDVSGYVGQATLVTRSPDSTVTAEWAIAHRMGVREEAMLKVMREQFEQPHGVALLPHGAAAVRMWPTEADARGGRVCVGMPTPLRSNCCAWIYGSFAMLSSRKSLPLPEEDEEKASLDKAWNHMLLQGPVVESLRSLIVHCTDHVLSKCFERDRYFALFPRQGDRFQTVLTTSTFDVAWVVSEVIQPAASRLSQRNLSALILAYTEWAGTWKQADIESFSEQISSMQWIPTAAGVTRTVKDSFDPARSPQEFRVVQDREAKLADLISDLKLTGDTVWNVLHLYGMKHDLTWEDVVVEAESIAGEQDVDRALKLMDHINRNHSTLHGCRDAALQRLKRVAWIPATTPTQASEPHSASQLLELEKVFPQSLSKLVWAVAPVACVKSTVAELEPGRSIEGEPQVLLEQVRALADQAGAGGAAPPLASAATLEGLVAAFDALLPHLPSLPGLEEHPRLQGVAFLPCLAPEGSSAEAQLFPARRAAFSARHGHGALGPVLGILKPAGPAARAVAEAAGARQEPRADVLAEALSQVGDDAPGPDLAVTLAGELALRLHAGEARPARILVPTASGGIEEVEKVYIDDAPWHQGEVLRLHPRVSAEDGRLLGCGSLRNFMAAQCEESAADGSAGDDFGQEADLVSQVRQLLQEYGDSADVVTEFVQNNDDAGAATVAFILHEGKFSSERLVDPRTAALQGPALYVCSDKPLTSEDIARMQAVGHSKKRLDFSSSGRFGVGLNVMYRYCECPQLLANGRLHFFDLTRSFVAKTGMRRGRQFTVERLHENFPDSYVPFEVLKIRERFPTVFRLALRAQRTDLGLEMGPAAVRTELLRAAGMADKLLLFARRLRRLEFHDGKALIAAHEVAVKDAEQHDAFFASLPASLPQLEADKSGQLRPLLAQKTITTKTKSSEVAAEWAIAHRVGGDAAMIKVLRAQYDRPHGVALLPHGAAAVKVKPDEAEQRTGRICSGMPTPLQSNSCAWIHGSFALLSSRKTLPLPEDGEDNPSLDKQWNKLLLEGPVAESLRGLLLHCTALVLFQGLSMERYLALFPLRGDRLQTILARATFKASIKEAVFPVAKGTKVTWVAGPSPTFFSKELSEQVQESLVSDGLKLVSLPAELLVEYEDALGKPCSRLTSRELCTFLREAFAKLHPSPPSAPSGKEGGEKEAGGGVELSLGSTGMACLASADSVTALLRFAVQGCWLQHNAERKDKQSCPSKYTPQELLGVPLLLTHAQEVTTFGGSVKYSNWRDVLPTKKGLFIDREAHAIAMDAVDTTIEGVQGAVETTLPGVRSFVLSDLIQYREELEASFRPDLGFMDPLNESLRVFWSLVADTFAEELQSQNYTEFFNAARKAFYTDKNAEKGASASKDPTAKAPPAATVRRVAWSKDIHDWSVLPIGTGGGNGSSLNACVALATAGTCVAVTNVNPDPDVVESLTSILHACGVNTVQHDVMSDDRISRLLCTLVISTNEDLLSLLIEHGRIEDLSGVQRHDLLAYYSLLTVKGGIDLKRVSQLPLFKTAAAGAGFIALQAGTTYCCVDPADAHSNALSRLMPPGMVMLAWPTHQVKPIYEQCGVLLCSGEDFMSNWLVPRLPEICAEDENGTASEPFLLQLHAFVVADGSERVRQAAAESAFVPSSDLVRMATPREFTSSAEGAAEAFAAVLSSFTPVWWLQQSEQHMELLHALGMLSTLSPEMILICAEDLDQDADQRPTERAEGAAGGPTSACGDLRSMRWKSFELVEEFARAAEEAWPRFTGAAAAQAPPEPEDGEVPLPPTSAPLNIEDMCRLLEAASLRILMARRLQSEQSKKDEIQDRNSRKRRALQKAQSGAAPQNAEVEFVPFLGTAFKKARQVMWSVCPLSDHRSPCGKKASHHLKNLLDKHPKGMLSVFGSLVMPHQAPLKLVLRHLACMCSISQSEPGVACVSSGSLLHEDLKACWAHLSEQLTSPDAEQEPECAVALKQLRTLPCVAVTSEDVADRPMDVITLTLPKFAFFQLPLLKGKEANLRLYLRQVAAETSQEAAVFRTFGASDTPHAEDYAGASERVAARAADLGSAGWEWIVAVLEACLKGVYEEISDKVSSTGNERTLCLRSLHMFTSDGSIAKASTLLWADEPRWLKRCEKAESLRLCNLNSQDQREMALALVANAGLRQLSAVIEERRVKDDADRDARGAPDMMMARVRPLVQSHELALGLHAVIVHNTEASKRILNTVADLRKELCTIKFRGTTGKLRSALFWKDASGQADEATMGIIPGSEQDQQVYFDEAERCVYIGRPSLGPGEDIFTAELVFALRRALPMLWSVDSFLLEAMLRCALKDGVQAIQPFLEMRAIKVDVLAPRHLGPGDLLPEGLQERLIWSMDATFGEGECAAVLAGDAFIIAEVSKWPEGQKPSGEGISRSYYMRVAADVLEARKHFEIYKIRSRASAEMNAEAPTTELVVFEEQEQAESPPSAKVAPPDTADDDADDAKHIADVKRYLHEMAHMEAEDYKAVMRRLFKTWHPDKAGNTPVAARIFHLLRSHEQWYKKRLAGEVTGDDSWLDQEDDGVSAAKSKSNSTGPSQGDGDLLALTAPEPGADGSADGGNEMPEDGAEDGAQASWFEEFEKEINQAREQNAGKSKEEGEAAKAAAQSARMPESAGEGQETSRAGPRPAAADLTEHRVVDKVLAGRYLQEAKLEMVVVRRLMKDSDDGLRSMPSRAVWHCQQAVEMALKSAMLRTCGVAEDEVVGGAAHNLIDFIMRLKSADSNTEEQRRAQQQVPLTDEDVEWLKRAYLAARYPKPGRYGVPGLLYSNADAERAQTLAEAFLQWSEKVEDLPDPGRCRRRWSSSSPAAAAAPAPPPPGEPPEPRKRPEAPAVEAGGEAEGRAAKAARLGGAAGGEQQEADGSATKQTRPLDAGDDEDVPRRWSRRKLA